MKSCNARLGTAHAGRPGASRALFGAALAAAVTWAGPVAASPMVELIPPGDDPGGQSAALSVQQWTEWAYSFDSVVDGGNPINDQTGQFQNQKQTFPVFLFGGNASSGIVSRTFKMPIGVTALIPIVNIACVSSDGFDCTDPGILDFVETALDNTDLLFLSINGEVLVDANTAGAVDAIEDQFRITTDFFDLPVAPNNWAGEPAGVWPNSFNSGYYAFVELPPGEHTIVHEGSLPDFDFTSGVAATVFVPEPATLLLFLGGVAGLALTTRRRAGGA
jgi:hypothetical protein